MRRAAPVMCVALVAAGCGGSADRTQNPTAAATRVCRRADERLARVPLPDPHRRNLAIPYVRLRSATAILTNEQNGLARLETDATARRRLGPLVARVGNLVSWTYTMAKYLPQPTPQLISSDYRSLNPPERLDLRADQAAARAAALPACILSSRARRVLVVHAFY